MPTYVYECGVCQKQFEVEQRMSDPLLTDCDCGEKGQLRRLISAGAGLIFKGSGFYATDYKGNGAPKTEKSEKSEKSETPAPSTGTCGGPSCPCANS